MVFAEIQLLSQLGAVVYAAQRRNGRHALKALGKSPVVRGLDEAEFAALETFRLTGQLDQSHEVRDLVGPYSLAHDEAQLLHERLGEVEVPLRYDARRFISANTPAEVVLAIRRRLSCA